MPNSIYSVPIGMVSKSTPRLDRSQWLGQAMHVLSKEGLAGLSLNNLIKEIHVTKGSFYWHFDNQAEFQIALVDYWHVNHTLEIARAADEVAGGPTDKLVFLAELIVTEDHARYDNVITSLAMQNHNLMPRIRASYNFRMTYVRNLFFAMGYRGKEATNCARVYAAFMTGEPMVNGGMKIKQRLAQLRSVLHLIVVEP